LQKLESQGYFKYTIEKDYKKLGYNIKANIIVYANPKELRLLFFKKNQSDLAKSLLKMHGVCSVDIITGEGDLLVCVRCKDIEELNRLILESIQGIEDVKNTRTLVV